MNNPFELPDIRRPINTGKNHPFEEAYIEFENDDAEILEDERENTNYRLMSLAFVLLLGVLFGRVMYLQTIKGGGFKALAEGNKLRIQYILAPRGLLEDAYGKVIASNTPSFELTTTTADLPKDKTEFDGRLTQVASILNQDPQSLLDTIKSMQPDSYSAQTLVQNISKDQALILMAKADDLKGFQVQDNPIRDYKDPLVFAHLTGYTGKITADELHQRSDQTNYILNDYIGKTGIENEYEQYLHGTPGKSQAEVDAAGHFQKTLAQVPAIAGDNVKLTIDYDLQKNLYDNLTAEMQKIGAKKAAAVATNPQTGAVLALISLPGLDSNMFARGIKSNEYSQLIKDPNSPLLNRAITGQYPPGSTIKPVMATAGLAEGVITTQTKILDDGVIRVGSYTFYGYEHGGLGVMDIYTAIAKSSDIYFYTVGGGKPGSNVDGLGPNRIAKWFRNFHLGSSLGIDLPSEKPGLVPDPDWKLRTIKEAWYLGDTYHESIGQGDVLATPLQVNSWTSTVANGGKVMQPHLLDTITDQNGKVVERGHSKVLAENFVDPNIIKVVQEGMRQTVTIGSGRALNTLPIEVSAKTGTAQFDPAHPDHYHAWFTSYAPSNNPQIAITVLIEGGGEGYAAAGPVAKAAYQWWADNRWNK